MVFGSIERIWSPQPIQYKEAIAIAVLGLLVNIVCALILGKAHGHEHGHSHENDHPQDHGHSHAHEPHQDLNLKSAYIHVIADAATSVLAIAALIGGLLFGWSWLDPAMGLVGAILVAVWAKGLIVQTGKVLLDREMDHPVVEEIREVVEASGAHTAHTRVTDLHVWRVGKNVYSCALSLVTQDTSLTPSRVRECLAVHEEIVHATIEIHRYPDPGV
jgi:cation diffusion facilitator family transporter